MSAGSPAAVMREQTREAREPLTRSRIALGASPVALALVLWSLSLPRIELDRISDFGLLPALPWTFYAALAVLTAGFFLALWNPSPREPVLALHVAALIAVIHATPTISYGTLRYAWAWKHVGIVDYIQRNGSIDPNIEFLGAYHNWPGFFALNALYTELAGFANALGYASWAPLFFNLAFLGALVVLFRMLTRDPHRLWLGIWFFFCTSWVGQDYFSPQALSYFLFLVLTTLCIGWFRARELPSYPSVLRFIRWRRAAGALLRIVGKADPDARSFTDSSRRERAAIALTVILVATAVASSHQLTPFVIVLATGGLVLFQRISLRSLPLLVTAISMGWAVLFAVGFLRGNLYWIVESVGNMTTNANSTLVNLADASYGQRVIARVDRALTLGVWVLGLLGFVRLARRGNLDLSVAVLALAPFGLLGATSYGGEVLFRVYFFSLPFFALLAAGIFYPVRQDRRSVLAATASGLVSVLLVSGLLVAYYGKERQNRFSTNEVRASRLLYENAVPGSLLIGGVNDYPWAFTHYESFKYLSLADLPPTYRRLAIARPAEVIAEISKKDGVPCAYVIITSAQKATVDMTGVMPAGSLDRILDRLQASPLFRPILRNPSATLLGLPVSASASECHLSE